MSNISKRVIQTMAVFGGTQVVSILCSIVRAKMVAIWIGPIGVGLFAILNTTTQMLQTGSLLSLRQSAVRRLAEASSADYPRMSSIATRWFAILGALGLILSILLSPLLSYWSMGEYGYWWMFALLGLCVLSCAHSDAGQAILQTSDRLKSLARIGAWSPLVATLLALPLLYYMRYHGIIIVVVLSSVVVWVITRIYTARPKRVHYEPSEFKREGRSMLGLGASMTISFLATGIANYVFISYLSSGYSREVTGIYQAGNTLVVQYAGIIFTALALEYFPRLVSVSHRPRMASTVMSHEMSILLLVLMPVIVLFMGFDKLIIYLLYSSDFYEALPLISIGITGSLFRAISYCMAYAMPARGDGRLYIVVEVASAAIGLALNILCFRAWGFMGAGIAYVAWYAIYTLMCGVVCYKVYGYRLSAGSVRVIALAISFSAITLALKLTLGYWCLLMLIPTSAVCLTGLSRMFRKRG